MTLIEIVVRKLISNPSAQPCSSHFALLFPNVLIIQKNIKHAYFCYWTSICIKQLQYRNIVGFGRFMSRRVVNIIDDLQKSIIIWIIQSAISAYVDWANIKNGSWWHEIDLPNLHIRIKMASFSYCIKHTSACNRW